MNPASDLRTLTIDLARRTAALKETLKALLKSLPPNPDAHQVAPNCCVVSFKALHSHSNWSPSYWVNSELVTRISEIIDKSRPETLRRNIVRILRRGSYETVCGWSRSQTMRIHPAALKALRRAWLGA